MSIALSTMQACQDKRVRMRFDDDYECVATLHSATQDMDGGLHLIYDKVEWANVPHAHVAKDALLYTEGERLISIEELPKLA